MGEILSEKNIVCRNCECLMTDKEGKLKCLNFANTVGNERLFIPPNLGYSCVIDIQKKIDRITNKRLNYVHALSILRTSNDKESKQRSANMIEEKIKDMSEIIKITKKIMNLKLDIHGKKGE